MLKFQKLLEEFNTFYFGYSEIWLWLLNFPEIHRSKGKQMAENIEQATIYKLGGFKYI